MNKKIRSALISVFYKDGLENIIALLDKLGVTIYSTGGTQAFIEKLGTRVTPVEDLTGYPSILGGRVKTLHPSVFGGILGKRNDDIHLSEMKQHKIPEIDLVIVDLYPFEATLEEQALKARESGKEIDEAAVIEKIDIGGPSMIRGAAKNFNDVVVIASKSDYPVLEKFLAEQDGSITRAQRRQFATKAFDVVADYDIAIAKYFNPERNFLEAPTDPLPLRYGENPHQSASFFGNLSSMFEQLHGKEISYNNLVDIDAAIQLLMEFPYSADAIFAIIKHTNVCGAARRSGLKESWDAALAADPESAFGGVLVCNKPVDHATAEAINNIFFEVLLAPAFEDDALKLLRSKKNRILIQVKSFPRSTRQYKSLFEGVLIQDLDKGNYKEWKETGARDCSEQEKQDLEFANILCKHLKSNAIALVKNNQLVGKGCGQTSRIDSLRQAIDKAGQFNFDLHGAVLASDAFFPFDDCVKLGHEAGITAFIQPGGSIRDNDSIEYCRNNDLAMVLTGMRHFKH
jgi:phosphoribosylaminoimidazolecarboxamide formyltransferase/IMP cyclohydrolase